MSLFYCNLLYLWNSAVAKFLNRYFKAFFIMLMYNLKIISDEIINIVLEFKEFVCSK